MYIQRKREFTVIVNTEQKTNDCLLRLQYKGLIMLNHFKAQTGPCILQHSITRGEEVS